MTCQLIWNEKIEGAQAKWHRESFSSPAEMFTRAEALFQTDNWRMMERHIWNGEIHTYSREYNG